MNRRKITRRARYMLAALALCALCACGSKPAVTDKAGLVEQCGLGLDTLRELGLFTAEFEVTTEDYVPDYEYEGYDPYPELPEDRYEGVITLRGYYSAESAEYKYSYSLDVDTDTGKITGLLINAKPRKDWVPFFVGFRSSPSNAALGFYDNPEALFDPEMTLGQVCAAWAQYQGYERWELPEGAGGDVSFIDAQELEVWNIGYSGSGGITAAFYRGGKKAPEYYAFNYTPAAAGPYFTVFSAEGPYVPETWTPVPPEEDPAEGEERSAVALINTQLDELRALGLLRSGLEVAWQDDHSNITAGRVSEEYEGKLYFIGNHDDCKYVLCYDAGTGKLDWLSICPRPADGSARVADVYGAGFGAVIDEGLTIGQYCELWAQYQGYERWELPQGVDEGTRYLDARTLPAWEHSIALHAADSGEEYYIEGLKIAFYRPGSDEPEYGYVKYGPSDIGPCVTIGSDYLFEHVFLY